MWLMNQLGKAGERKAASLAHLTYAEEGRFGAAGEREWRELPMFGPGTAYQPCEEEVVLAVESQQGTVCVGVQMDLTGLEPGELRLGRTDGAWILLRKDGSIQLNGLTITPQGEMIPAQKEGD